MPLYGSRRAKMKESDIEADDAKSFEEKPDRFDFLSNFYPFTAGDITDAFAALDPEDELFGVLEGIVPQNCGKVFNHSYPTGGVYRLQPILGYASTVKLALADPPTKVDKPKTSADEMADHMELVQLNGPSEDTTSARKARASTAEKSVKLDESAAEGDGTERSISNEASTDDEAMKDRTEPQSEKTSELCAADWAEELAPATPFNWYRTIIVAEQPAGQRIWSVEHLPIARFNAFNVKGLVVSGFLRDADKIQDIAMPVFSRGHSFLRSKVEYKVESMHKPLMIGGVKVAKGDIIFMDIHDGVVICIPREKAEQVLEWLKANMTEDAKRRVKAGIPANQLFVPGIFAAAQFERPVMGSMLIKEDDVIFSRKTPFGLDIDHALTKREEEHIRGDKEAASQKKKILDRKKNGPKTPRKANARQKITEDDQLPEDIEEARDSEDTEENEGLGSDDDAEGGGTQTQAKRKPTTTRKRKAPAKKSGKANAKNTDKESGFEENPKKKVQKASTRQTAKKPPVVYSAESDLDSETEAAPARTRRTRIAKNQAAPPEGPITEGAEGDEPVVEAEQMPKKGSRAKRNVKGGAKTAAAARKKPAPQKGTGRPVRGRKKVLVIDDSGDDDKPEPEPSGEDDDEFEPADD